MTTEIERLYYEIERRTNIFKSLDIVLQNKFIITPGDRKKRMRRDEVHRAILGGGLSGGGNWRMKRIISERLLSLGCGRILSSGRRFYTGISLRSEKELQDGPGKI